MTRLSGQSAPLQHIRCVVFDFAFTLCSQLYFTSLRPQWGDVITCEVFGPSPNLSDRWMAGDLCSPDVAAHLTNFIPLPADEIQRSLEDGCRHMHFNPAVWALARQQRSLGRATALVTLNMDVFSQIVVPAHRLHETFDVIVCSADHKELNKKRLFEIAFQQLGHPHDFPTSLLIDDSPAQVATFRRRGGLAHRYIDDASLQHWLAEQSQIDRV